MRRLVLHRALVPSRLHQLGHVEQDGAKDQLNPESQHKIHGHLHELGKHQGRGTSHSNQRDLHAKVHLGNPGHPHNTDCAAKCT